MNGENVKAGSSILAKRNQPHPIYRVTAKELERHGAKFTVEGLRFHFRMLEKYTNPSGGGLDKIPLNTIPWERRFKQQFEATSERIVNPLYESEEIFPREESKPIFLRKKTQHQVANHLLGIGAITYWTGSKGRSTLLGLDVDDHESGVPGLIQRNSREAVDLFVQMTGWTPVTSPSKRGIHGFLIIEKGWLTALATNKLWREIIKRIQAEAKNRGLVANLECKGTARMVTEDVSYGGLLLKDPFTGMNPTDKELTTFWTTLEDRKLTDTDLNNKMTSLLGYESTSSTVSPQIKQDLKVAQTESVGRTDETFEPGTWVKNCRKWAVQGLEEQDSMPDAVFELSKWFYFIELFEMDEDERFIKVVGLLQKFCLDRHNGFITRLNLDKSSEVMSHVKRIVQSMIQRTTDSAMACFERIRDKRSSGQYRDQWFLESCLLPQISPLSSVRLNVCCSVCGTEKEKKKDIIHQPSEWVYVPDLTPLPACMEQTIRDALKERGAKDKTYDKLVGFLNHLKSKNGEARLSVKSLKKMGFSDHRARQHISMLRPMGLLNEKSGSPVAHVGKLFFLTVKARELLGMPVFDPDELGTFQPENISQKNIRHDE